MRRVKNLKYFFYSSFYSSLFRHFRGLLTLEFVTVQIAQFGGTDRDVVVVVIIVVFVVIVDEGDACLLPNGISGKFHFFPSTHFDSAIHRFHKPTLS